MISAAEVLLLVKAKDEASGVLKKISGEAHKMGSTLQSVGRTGAIALAGGLGIATVAAVKFAGKASDLNESVSKANVVFGASAASVHKWAQSSAKDMGLSRQAATEAAGSFGNLFVAMGLGQVPAADLSKDIVGLAADLASFNNISVDDALIKLRAGLVGEAEPLRVLGVNINAATVEAKAMQMGLADASGELTEAAKVQARYALILDQTKTAQGDFSRTSSGLANQQRILRAEWENLQASLGNLVLPVMTKVVAFMAGEVVPILERAAAAVGDFATVISAGLAGDISTAADAFNKLPAPLQALAMWLADNRPQIENLARDIKSLAQDAIKGWVDILAALQPKLDTLATWLNDHRTVLIFVAVGVAGILALMVSWPILVIAAAISVGILNERLQEWRENNEKLDKTLTAIEITLGAVGWALQESARGWTLFFTDVWGASVFYTDLIVAGFWGMVHRAEETARLIAVPFVATFGVMKQNWEDFVGLVKGTAGDFATIGKQIADDFDSVTTAIQWVIDRVYQLIEAINRIPSPKDLLGSIPGVGGAVKAVRGLLAEGARNFEGGLAVVGEKGAEIVELPSGANVYSNRDSRRMLAEGGNVITEAQRTTGGVTNFYIERVELHGDPASGLAALGLAL